MKEIKAIIELFLTFSRFKTPITYDTPIGTMFLIWYELYVYAQNNRAQWSL